MKITKRQLRRIIREEKQRLLEAAPDGWYSDQDETFADYLYRTNTERDEEEAAYFEEMEELEAMREPEVGQDWPKRSGMGRRGADGTPRIAGKRSSAERDHMYGRKKFREGITKRQLRRIIREVGIAPGVRQSLTSKLYEAVVDVLSRRPGMSGAELVDTVNQMHPSIDAELIYDFLDQLLEDGEVFFDVEEDAWSLT